MVRERTSARASRARAQGAVIALALLASACAPQLAMQGPESRAPIIAGDHYVTRDGLELGLQHWDADKPRAIIVALHGMSDYANAFAMPGAWWAKHDISTYAFDQRGFGHSPNAGMWAGGDTMRRDFADFVDVVRAHHPGLPVFALGESMGGAVIMSAMADPAPPRVNGIILSAPAVWGWRTMPVPYRVALWTAAHAAPWGTLSGSGLHIVASDNTPMLIALGRDPLYQQDVRADAVYGLVTLMDEGYDAAGKMGATPILFLYGDKDQVIPRAPTQEVIAKLGPSATVKHYAHGYHMLLRDLEAETVWKDIADWILSTGRKNS